MRPGLLILLLSLALVAAAAGSLLVGSSALTPDQLLATPLGQTILVELRLPRLVLAILVGGVLGLSGAVLQGLLRNPLAEPGVLGVSASAALGAVIAIHYGLAAVSTLAVPVFGLVGAMTAGAILFLLARRGGTLSLILAGVAIASVAGAGISVALNLAPGPYAAYEIMTWLMGSLSDRSWHHVALAAPFIALGGALLALTGRALDALALGEAQAESLGVDLRTTRRLALFGTACGVGGATAIAGTIGFVGLVAPHLVRPLVGHRPAAILAPSTLVGAILVVLADIATRTIRFGPEIRLGVFISIVGAPLFLWLVLHVRRQTP